MKTHFSYIILAVGFSGWLMSCGNSSGINKIPSEKRINSNQSSLREKPESVTNSKLSNDSSTKNVVESKFDPTTFIVDTTLPLNNYHIIIGKEKFDINKKEYSKDDLEFNPIIIYFTLTENDSVVLKRKFEENWFARINSFPASLNNYFTLISFGGGSGYLATIYKLDFEKTPTFTQVATYHELSSPLFSRDGSEILIMNGIWDMSADGDEGHFSEHKYEISTIDLTSSKFTRSAGGTTNGKYPSADVDFSSEKLLREIHQTEPLVFKGINLDKYSF